MTEQRLCARQQCQQPLVQRDNERPDKFLGRQTCSPECAQQYRHEKRRARLAALPVRHCKVCKKQLVPRSHEMFIDYARRKTCSVSCARKAQISSRTYRPPADTGQIPARACHWCEKVYQPKSDSQSYCHPKCGIAHAKQGYGMNKREREAIRNRPPGPKGCATAEEWLAQGGKIFRIEAPPRLPGPIPVRSTHGSKGAMG